MMGLMSGRPGGQPRAMWATDWREFPVGQNMEGTVYPWSHVGVTEATHTIVSSSAALSDRHYVVDVQNNNNGSGIQELTGAGNFDDFDALLRGTPVSDGYDGDKSGIMALYLTDELVLAVLGREESGGSGKKFVFGTTANNTETGSWTFGTEYYIRMHREGSTTQGKFWAVGTAEPGWLLSKSSSGGTSSISFYVASKNALCNISWFSLAIGTGVTAPLPTG
jgi:hypothetical protein